MSRQIITIDGLSGVGKTTIAAIVAQSLGLKLLYSGLIYRAFALKMLERLGPSLSHNMTEETIRKEAELVVDNHLAFLIAAGRGEISLRSLESVSQTASILSKFKAVRELLLPIQRLIYQHESFVAEGRDMGSVVFPDADLKFYIETAPTLRAHRRLSNSHSCATTLELSSFISVLMDIVVRDVRDINRQFAPCIKTPDMIVIVNHHDVVETCNEIMFQIRSHLNLF